MTPPTAAAPVVGPPAAQPPAVPLVNLTIDGVPVQVPKGTLVIRAAEQVGIQIPRFCDHPLLDPVGACRQCLVDVEGQRKPLASCTTTVSEGMVVHTQASSPVAAKAQQGVMELLLTNHPLDCPVCDKGGECPLQNQAMSTGAAESRFVETKRTYPKPLPISSQVLLDRERCVLCARCTRFSDQVAGDPFITLIERGALQQVGIYEKEPFDSYFQGNTVQICPVGALTSAAYRFRARPFDLVSDPTTCEHCASGCALRVDHRRGKVMRRPAGEDLAVNEDWSCDKGRFAFTYARQADRITSPLVRGEDGELRTASWPEALGLAARLLTERRGQAAAVVGGRSTIEDAYAYAKFTRVVLGTNDVDFRARPHSAEEEAFLGARVAAGDPNAARNGLARAVSYADLEAAPAVVVVGLDAEEESPIVFLRLRKAFRRSKLPVHVVAPLTTRGSAKMGARLVPAAPGTEAEVLAALADGSADVVGEAGPLADAAAALRNEGAVLLVGERLATVPGALTAAARLADATGARLAWVPRRAGERGALDAGATPALLPFGRTVADPAARADVEAVWESAVPATPGRDLAGILQGVLDGDVRALVVGGVDVDDLPDPAAARAALAAAEVVVSLELRRSAVTELADIVFPVAAVAEKAGTFVDWEGRLRPFPDALRLVDTLTDARVLSGIADETDAWLGLHTVAATRAELDRLADWSGARHADPAVEPAAPGQPGPGQAVLATWHQLLDNGRMQDGEPALAGTARPVVALISAGTAAELGLDPAAVAEGLVDAGLEISGASGGFVLPVAIADLPDRVVWTPTNSGASRVRAVLGAGAGDVVGLRIVPPADSADDAADAEHVSTVPGDTRAATIGGQQ